GDEQPAAAAEGRATVVHPTPVPAPLPKDGPEAVPSADVPDNGAMVPDEAEPVPAADVSSAILTQDGLAEEARPHLSPLPEGEGVFTETLVGAGAAQPAALPDVEQRPRRAGLGSKAFGVIAAISAMIAVVVGVAIFRPSFGPGPTTPEPAVDQSSVSAPPAEVPVAEAPPEVIPR